MSAPHGSATAAATGGTAPPAPPPALPAKARIALLTVRSFAVEHAIPVIRARSDAELVCVLTTPGPKGRRSDAHVSVVHALHRCGYSGVDVVCSNSRSRWPDLLALYGANLLLVSGFPWLIPAAVLDDPRLSLGVINFHNSHLPRFMGPNAFGWYMLSGEDAVGYTCHRMSADFDTGPVLFQETVPLDVNEDYQDLKRKMPAVFSGMVDRAIACALAGDPGTPQVGTPSHAPKFEDSFRWVDFRASARDVHNKVRAYYGERDHPRGALAALEDGSVVCLTKTRYHPPVKVVLGPVLREDSAEGVSGGVGKGDPDLASLTSVTTHSSESLTTAGTGGTAADVGHPGSTIGLPNAGGVGGSFWIQCGDTALEVLEWHRVNADDEKAAFAARPPMPLPSTPTTATATDEAAAAAPLSLALPPAVAVVVEP